MTTSVKNIIVVIVAVLSFFGVAFNASAQSRTNISQHEVDSLYVLNMRTVMASISDKANKDFAWESEGKTTSNQLEVRNLRGFTIGAEAGYNLDHGYTAGLKVGYQGAGLRQFAPEAAITVGNAKVDGLTSTTYGVEVRALFELGSERIKAFAGPTAGYTHFSLDTEVEIATPAELGQPTGTDRVKLYSNAFTVGAMGGVKIKIGSIKKTVKLPLYDENGKKSIHKAYTIKNPIYVTVAGSYKTYQVEKPGHVMVKVNEIGVKAGVTFLF